MLHSITLPYNFQPDKVGLFGNGVVSVEVRADGIRLTRKRSEEDYSFADIAKITARGYASPTPIFIYVTIHIKVAAGSKPKKIELKLHPNLVDTNILLGAHRDYILGADFPNRLGILDEIELGGLGASIRLRGERIVLGDRAYLHSDVESFTHNQNGFYDLKLRPLKPKLGISPEYAQNILATQAILHAIIERNQS